MYEGSGRPSLPNNVRFEAETHETHTPFPFLHDETLYAVRVINVGGDEESRASLFELTCLT